jgi:hypothetical protein
MAAVTLVNPLARYRWIGKKGFQEQYDFGIETLTKFGWTP